MPLKKSHHFFEIDYLALENGQPFDAVRLFLENGPIFIKSARAMQKKEAVSHRDVFFGAAALLNNVSQKKLRGYLGYNYSPVNGIPRYCAEMRAYGRGFTKGYTQREAFVIATPTDKDVIESINGVRTETAYPCVQRCRGLMEDATLVLTVGDKEPVYEVNTGRGIRHMDYGPLSEERRSKRNKNAPIETVPIYDPNFTKWSGALAIYDELAVDLVDIESIEDLRMARAEAAVSAIRSLAA